MTTAKHTQGPWRVTGTKGYGFQIEGDDTLIAKTVYKGSGEEESANAFLIAAAPELLALARELDAHSAHAIGFDLDKLPALMDNFRTMASAAIAKAEGKA